MDQPSTTNNMSSLKRQIDDEIRPLIVKLKAPVDRFNIYLSFLRDDWSDEIAYKAFEEAKQIENPESKAYSLQSLRIEITIHESSDKY